MPTAETPVLDDSLANLVEKVSQRLLVLTDGEHRTYVGSELPAVDRALSRIQNEGLAPGPVFCEWGSGLGGVCGVAAINGFRPYGIEIQRELVASARSLASDLNYTPWFLRRGPSCSPATRSWSPGPIPAPGSTSTHVPGMKWS